MPPSLKRGQQFSPSGFLRNRGTMTITDPTTQISTLANATELRALLDAA
jgi:hypothetical protein